MGGMRDGNTRVSFHANCLLRAGISVWFAEEIMMMGRMAVIVIFPSFTSEGGDRLGRGNT